jgi:dTMP kinase
VPAVKVSSVADPEDPMSTNSGIFVAVEGLDGSGGTTQVQRLAARIRAISPELDVIETREPSDGPVGRLIREQLAAGEVGDRVLPYLFAADRRSHLDTVVLPALARGAVVISDRYALSSMAYQAEALGLDRVMELNRDFPAPALTLMLDLDPELGVERIVRRGIPMDRFEPLERQRRIAAAYEIALLRCEALGWRIARMDASVPIEALAAAVWGAVGPLLGVRG